MKKVFLLACFVFGLTACSTDDVSKTSRENGSQPSDLEIRNLEVNTVLQGEALTSNYDTSDVQAKQFVFHNEVAWQSFILEVENNNGHIGIVEELRSALIEFNREVVVVVLDEQKYSGGYSVDVLSVVELDKEIAVTVGHVNKGGINAVLTRPFHIVKIANYKKPIVFNFEA